MPRHEPQVQSMIDTQREVSRILSMSDEEVLAECRAQGIDPEEEAERMRLRIEVLVSLSKILRP